jgi:hypothetical protein
VKTKVEQYLANSETTLNDARKKKECGDDFGPR